MENKGGKNEARPAMQEQAEQRYFGAVEKFPSEMEMPQVETETIPQQPEVTPVAHEITRDHFDMDVVENTMPVVERNAEQMPKPYVKIVEDTAKELKTQPYKLQNKVIEFKKDYLRQAFGRELGKVA